jgi:ASC-1-like (ASCH) protein
MILNGVKTLEGRVGYGNIKNIQVNDHIYFNGRYKAKITKVSKYPSFRQAVNKENYKKLIPDADSHENAISIYESLFPLWKQRQLGVYIFEFELIGSNR